MPKMKRKNTGATSANSIAADPERARAHARQGALRPSERFRPAHFLLRFHGVILKAGGACGEEQPAGVMKERLTQLAQPAGWIDMEQIRIRIINPAGARGAR
jgi:hypothetical protein